MRNALDLLKSGRKQNRAPQFAASKPSATVQGLPSSPLPEPQEVVDSNYIGDLASTRQLTQIERRAENKNYHLRKARAICRKQFIAPCQAQLVKVESLLVEKARQRGQARAEKEQFERFGGVQKQDQKAKKPSTRWAQAQFWAVVLVMLVLIASGTFTVSAYMLDSTAFSGAHVKTITVGLSLFLAPSIGASIPFTILLKNRRRWAYGYLGFLDLGQPMGQGATCPGR